MAESPVPRSKRDLLITVTDDGAGNTYTVSKEPGDFTYDAPLYDLVLLRDNGVLFGARKGDDQPVTWGWSIHMRDAGSSTDATLPDIAEERGWWSSNATSTTNQESDVPTYDTNVTIDGSAFGEADQTMVFADGVLRGSGTLGAYPANYAVQGTSVTATKPTVS